MNAKTITSVELCQEGRNWSCSDDARRRLEKIFTGSKNLYKINPSTNRLRSQGVMNWAEADRWRKVLTDGSNTRRDLTKIECEEIRDRLPLIRTQYFLSEKELLLDGEAVGDDVVFMLAPKYYLTQQRLLKLIVFYLLEFLDDDWRLGLPEERS